ncbi:porin [Oricola sp.]|uniref:porin n=1 Tax=Oricola sp. TaxID=1979950 RepID=UPI003BAD6381
MKIKSLLLGSAAAMFAVSGAQAADRVADVVIPEPEVVEYVRVCDAYGSGFFYIPGTETCLRIHGYVRVDIGFGDLNDRISANSEDDPDGNETYNMRSRASFRVSTARETDLGTLRTYVETRWQFDTNGDSFEQGDIGGADTPGDYTGYSNDHEFSINFAYIDLNGFRIGKSESLFTTFTGYAGGVINDTTGGGYGPFDTNLIQYTYTGGAFTLAVGVEQGDDSNYTKYMGIDPGENAYNGWGIDDYAPHVVVGAGYDAGIVNIRGVVGFDTRSNFSHPVTGDPIFAGGWSGKVRVDADVTDTLSGFIMALYGENESAYTTWATGAPTDETWSIIGGATFDVTDDTAINAQVQWVEGNGGDDVWAVAANVTHTLVDGMIIRPEVQWLNDNDGDDEWGGVVRFQVSY